MHGGRAVIEAVINTLKKQEGFRIAEPGEFTKRAVLNGKMDLTKAEGINDLIQAETEAQRVQSFAQVDGALSSSFWVAEKATKIAAHVEAYIDFPDEEIPESTLTSLGDEMSVLIRDIEKGLNDGRRGEIFEGRLSYSCHRASECRKIHVGELAVKKASFYYFLNNPVPPGMS